VYIHSIHAYFYVETSRAAMLSCMCFGVEGKAGM